MDKKKTKQILKYLCYAKQSNLPAGCASRSDLDEVCSYCPLDFERQENIDSFATNFKLDKDV